jgi:hypothetical protein
LKHGLLRKGELEIKYLFLLVENKCVVHSRFPVISGFRVSWDSRQPPGRRVLGIWLQKEVTDDDYPTGGTTTPKLVDGDEIKRERQGKKYIIVTREYMAQGHDGFLPLKGSKYLIDDEVGKMYSTLVRQYLLVSRDTDH